MDIKSNLSKHSEDAKHDTRLYATNEGDMD